MGSLNRNSSNYYGNKGQAAAQPAGDVPVIGSGRMTFGDIDKAIKDNPDSQYFRIKNGGDVNDKRVRNSGSGRWSDEGAAIVSQNSDKDTKGIFRYVNISPAGSAKGKNGERATVGIDFVPQDYYKATGKDFDRGDGLIISRAEYGNLKEKTKSKDKSGFLKQPEKSPGMRVEENKPADTSSVEKRNRNKSQARKTILTDQPGGLGSSDRLSGSTVLG